MKNIYPMSKQKIDIDLKKIKDDVIRWGREVVKYSGLYLYIAYRYFSDNVKKIEIGPKKNMYVIISVAIVFAIWSIFFRIFFARYNFPSGDTSSKMLQIQSGMNVSEVATMLNDNNVIGGTVWFKAAYRLSAGNETFKAGTYIFYDGMSNREIISMLTSEILKPKSKITIPEGAKIELIARIAEKELNLSQEKIIDETKNDSLINVLGLRGKISNLEGFLFPDTYYLYGDISEKTLVSMMFDEFIKKVLTNPAINSSFVNDPDKLLSVIVLASIVQAETGNIPEMPRVAGLYYNRIQKKMFLQADPTIQYVLPDGPRLLVNKDYKFNSPYNTYLHYGLPPGPINNPGIDAIKAVVNPEKNDFLFMVADTNKTHRFAKTYKEHLQNISDIRKGGR